MLVVAAVLGSGCGSSTHSAITSSAGASTSTSTAQAAPAKSTPGLDPSEQRAHLASIGVGSTAIVPGGFAKRYTCHGTDISPPVSWAGVPSSTKELIVVVRTLSGGRLTDAWTLAGIAPPIDELRAGKVPAGAVVGRNSSGEVGYRLCPPSGKTALVVIGVYALPNRLNLKPGFGQDPVLEAAISPNVAWGSVSAVVHPTRKS